MTWKQNRERGILLMNWRDTLTSYRWRSTSLWKTSRTMQLSALDVHLSPFTWATTIMQLFFFPYLDHQQRETPNRAMYSSRCKHLAVQLSDILRLSHEVEDWEALYVIVGHMTVVLSAALIHTLLFGQQEELPQTRSRLCDNFAILLKLREYWPAVELMVSIPPIISFRKALLIDIWLDWEAVHISKSVYVVYGVDLHSGQMGCQVPTSACSSYWRVFYHASSLGTGQVCQRYAVHPSKTKHVHRMINLWWFYPLWFNSWSFLLEDSKSTSWVAWPSSPSNSAAISSSVGPFVSTNKNQTQKHSTARIGSIRWDRVLTELYSQNLLTEFDIFIFIHENSSQGWSRT